MRYEFSVHCNRLPLCADDVTRSLYSPVFGPTQHGAAELAPAAADAGQVAGRRALVRREYHRPVRRDDVTL